MPFLDPTFILLIPALILAFYAQSKVRGTFTRYSQVRGASGLTGAQVARKILDAEGLSEVPVEKTAGDLTDHYHPRKRQLFLSETVYNSRSVAALGVAAHETGHALQHKNAYAPLAFRNAFVPVATVTTNLAFPLFLIGFIIGGTVKWLMDVGILFFVGALVFHLVTLPVEFNASARAISVLEGRGYLQGTEVQGARKVLNAAAWTYVAAATMALSQLLRLLLLRSSRD